MCSRTEPFSTMSSMKRRPPLRGGSSSNAENDDDDSTLMTEDSSTSLKTGSNSSPRANLSPSSPRISSYGSSPRPSSSSPLPPPNDVSSYRDASRRMSYSDDDDDVNVEKDDSDDDDDDDPPARRTRSSAAQRLYPNLNDLKDDARAESSRSPSSRSPTSIRSIPSNTESSFVRRRINGITSANESTNGPRMVKDYNGVPVAQHSSSSAFASKYRGNDDNDTNNDPSDQNWSTIKICLLCCLSVIALVAGAVWPERDRLYALLSHETVNYDDIPERGEMRRVFDELKSFFPNQPRRTWLNFNGPLRRVLRDGRDSTEPALVLVAGNPLTARCLVTKAANALAGSFSSPLVLDGIQFQNQDSFSVKKHMDSAIRTHLGDRGEKVVVIFGVDLLPPQATILLHGFADHEHSPFKDAFFFLTIGRRNYETTKKTEDDLRRVEKRVGEDFDEALATGLGVDATKALMARIANSVVVLVPEDSTPC